MKSLEKLEQLSGGRVSNWLEKERARQSEGAWHLKSKKIATRILLSLKKRGMTQVDLANSLNVSPQQVNKIVKGNENLSLQTICKIEQLLEVQLLEIPGIRETQTVSVLTFQELIAQIDNCNFEESSLNVYAMSA
ncbi:MAG: helix-turn-helix transcriptional regulator [Chitinophagales bacterium]